MESRVFHQLLRIKAVAEQALDLKYRLDHVDAGTYASCFPPEEGEVVKVMRRMRRYGDLFEGGIISPFYEKVRRLGLTYPTITVPTVELLDAENAKLLVDIMIRFRNLRYYYEGESGEPYLDDILGGEEVLADMETLPELFGEEIPELKEDIEFGEAMEEAEFRQMLYEMKIGKRGK